MTQTSIALSEIERDTARRAAFIQGLHELADFLVSHPQIQAPQCVALNVFVSTRDEIVTHAKVCAWEKVYAGEWFWLRKEFGPDLTLEITIPRKEVCRRVVIGTHEEPAKTVEDVEWECSESILS